MLRAAAIPVGLPSRLARYPCTTEQTPMIMPILHRHDPIALPTANSVEPASVPVSETINSGNEVAMLTIVAPTITGGMRVIRGDLDRAVRKQIAALGNGQHAKDNHSQQPHCCGGRLRASQQLKPAVCQSKQGKIHAVPVLRLGRK